MLRKIRSLVLNYDKRFWEWNWKARAIRDPDLTERVDPVKPRSTKSGRSMDATSNKNEIPDPWD